MSQQNPIIQATPQGTLNASIEVLQSLITTLAGDNPSDDGKTLFSAADIAGFKLSLDCAKVALEEGFAQYADQGK
jgi:hypothetical protein